MLGNLILEMCNAPGTTADCNLLGPTSGRLPFGFWFASGAQCFYVMSDGTQSEWGIGTYTAGSPNKLNRTTVLKNSAGSNARLNFLGETKVYNETPAERTLWVDNAGNISVAGANITAKGFYATATGGGAIIGVREQSGASDSKAWDFLSSGDTLWGRAMNDPYTVSSNWLTVTRTGMTLTGITLNAPSIALQGSVAVKGGLQAAGVTSRDPLAATGYSSLNLGDATNAGYVAFFKANGVRAGYVGYGATTLNMNAENGYTGWSMTGTLSVTGAFSAGGAFSITGAATVGSLTSNGAINATNGMAINGQPGQSATLTLKRPNGYSQVNQVIGYSGGFNRWILQLGTGDNDPQDGSNIGSNFLLGRCNDAGTYLDAPIYINRQTAEVSMSGGLVTAGRIFTNGARVISCGNGNNPSFCVWDTHAAYAAGIYADGGLRFGGMDGSGNPIIYYGGMVTENPIGDGNRGGLYMTGNVSAAISLYAGYDLSVGRNVGIGGTCNVASRLYVAAGDNSINCRVNNSYTTICGSTDFSGGANFILSGGGRAAYAHEWYWGSSRTMMLEPNGNFHVTQGIFIGEAAGADFVIYGNSPGRAIRFQADGWGLFWSNDGSLVYRANNTAFGGNNAMSWTDGAGNFHCRGAFMPGDGASDERVKKEVAPWKRGLDVIMRLTPVSYLYNGLGGTSDDGKRRVGLIAQQLEKLVPEAVYHTPPQPVDPFAEEKAPDARFPGQLSVDEKPLLFVALNALRELNDKLNKTTDDLAVAIRRIVQLESRAAQPA
jgi:hypothetical protein